MSQDTHSSFNYCATFLYAKSYTDKVSASLKCLSNTSAHSSSTNLATLSASLDDFFEKTMRKHFMAKHLIWKLDYKVSILLLILRCSTIIDKLTKLNNLGLNVMIVCFFLKVFHESIPFRINVFLQTWHIQHSYLVLSRKCMQNLSERITSKKFKCITWIIVSELIR